MRDWTFLGFLIVTLTLLLSVVIGEIDFDKTVLGILLAFWIILLLMIYARVLEIRDEIKSIRIAALSKEISEDANIISMEEFIHRESTLESGDTVLLLANTLDYDRKYFLSTIESNLKKGVRYYYLMGGAESRRNWELFLEDLKRRGVKKLPDGRFNTINVVPLVWTTAVYEYGDPTKGIAAISILEHRYDSKACIELSDVIAKRMRQHFWEFWEALEEDSLKQKQTNPQNKEISTGNDK